MNRFRFLFPGLFLLLISFAFADNFTITKFEGDAVGAPDDYIAAEFNDELKKANPNAIQDGRFYVRQKFEDPFDDEATTYGLYQGKLTGAGKAKLGKFALIDKPYSEVLKTKFYLSANSKPDQDVDRVYFDGKFVYVEGESPIFVNIDGKMTELKPSIERVGYFNITSQPSGADISINEEPKGRTPSKVTVLGTRAVVLTLSKPGFYTKIKVMKPLPGQTVEVGELLTEKKDIETPVQSFKTRFLDLSRKNDAKSLQSLRTSVQTKMDEWPRESGALIQKQLALFPVNPAQTNDEAAAEYQNRTTTWEKERTAEQDRLQMIADKATEDLRSLLKQIDEALEGSQFGVNHIYIPSSSIQFGRFNKAQKTFELTIKHSAPEASFTYSGTFSMGSLDQAQLLAKKDQLQGVLRAWSLTNDAGKTPVMQSIVLYLNKTLLTPSAKGSYTSVDATPALTAKGVEFEGRLAKLNGIALSDFNTKLEQGTEKLLVTFETAAPPPPAPVVATPVAPPPPAPVVTPPPPKPAPEPESSPEPEAQASSDNEESEDVDADAVTAAPDATATDDEDEREASADDAEDDLEAKFGKADEYRNWAAWGLVASAVASGVGAALQHMNYNKSQKAYDTTAELIQQHKNGIQASCAGLYLDPNQMQVCIDAVTAASRYELYGTLHVYEPILANNKTIMDSYSTGRTLMLLLTASSIAGSVVLFTW